MSLSKNVLNTLIAGAFTVALAGAAGQAAFAEGGIAHRLKPSHHNSVATDMLLSNRKNCEPSTLVAATIVKKPNPLL